MNLTFLAYLETGELLTRPSVNLHYVEYAAREYFVSHPEERITMLSATGRQRWSAC